MTQKEIRVGIVGADTKASWAKVSHVPAIRDLPGMRLAAVATRSERSARDAAEAFGADRWYSDPFAMIRDDRIAVKVPAHRELVLMALAAGKTVYCEASLGRSVAETEEMARAVRSHHSDRLAGPAQSGRTTRGRVSFPRKNRPTAKRQNCIPNIRIRAGNPHCP
jgi:predicted dehydrogenase